MSKSSAYEQLVELSYFLADKPEFPKILEYLSTNISPTREICGVTLGVLNDQSLIDATIHTGFQVQFPKLTNIHIDSNNPLARALRNQTIELIDLIDTLQKFPDLPREYLDTPYKSICFLPIGETLIINLSFEATLPEMGNYLTYFECIRANLIMYLALQTKRFINEFEINGQLSPRQKKIYEMIMLGKSNRQIADELSYSVSLIRQESMRIYHKLGIDGRHEIRSLKINENVLSDKSE